MSLKWKIFLLVVLSSMLGCSKQESSLTSKVKILMPESLETKSSEVTSFSKKACFAINISGVNIPEIQPGACDKSYGRFAGLVSPGQSIEIEVNRGENRAISLYYIVSDEVCQEFNSQEGLGKTFGTNNVYRVGFIEKINFDQSIIKIALPIQWPNQKNTLQNLFAFPESCKRGSDIINKMTVAEAGVVLGAYQELLPSQTFINVRIKENSMETIDSQAWETQILPARLGVEQ